MNIVRYAYSTVFKTIQVCGFFFACLYFTFLVAFLKNFTEGFAISHYVHIYLLMVHQRIPVNDH